VKCTSYVKRFGFTSSGSEGNYEIVAFEEEEEEEDDEEEDDEGSRGEERRREGVRVATHAEEQQPLTDEGPTRACWGLK
jgi:hypothetical protein